MAVKIPINPNKLLIQHILLSMLLGNFLQWLNKIMSITKFIGKIIIMKMSVMMLDGLENNLKSDALKKATHIPLSVKETRRSRYMTTLKIVEYTKDLSLLLLFEGTAFLSGSGAVTIRSGSGEIFSIFLPQFKQNLDPVVFL
jgi:hypothetical protein